MYERIRNLREDLDYTQSDIAKMLNCSQECYSYYENGRRDIPTDILSKLASIFNTSVDYLLNITDIQKPYPKNKNK